MPWQELLITNALCKINCFGPRDAKSKTLCLYICPHAASTTYPWLTVELKPRDVRWWRLVLLQCQSANQRIVTNRRGGAEGKKWTLGLYIPGFCTMHDSVMASRKSSSTTLEFQSDIRARKAKSRIRSMINDATKRYHTVISSSHLEM